MRRATARGTTKAFSKRGTNRLVCRVTVRGTAEAFSAGPFGRRILASNGTCPLSRDKEVWSSPQSVLRHREGYNRGLLHHPVRKRDSDNNTPHHREGRLYQCAASPQEARRKTLRIGGASEGEARTATIVTSGDGRGRPRAPAYLPTSEALTIAPICCRGRPHRRPGDRRPPESMAAKTSPVPTPGHPYPRLPQHPLPGCLRLRCPSTPKPSTPSTPLTLTSSTRYALPTPVLLEQPDV